MLKCSLLAAWMSAPCPSFACGRSCHQVLLHPFISSVFSIATVGLTACATSSCFESPRTSRGTLSVTSCVTDSPWQLELLSIRLWWLASTFEWLREARANRMVFDAMLMSLEDGWVSRELREGAFGAVSDSDDS